MKKPVKMFNIIKLIPAGKKFYFDDVKGLRMTAPVFASRIKEYVISGEIKKTMEGKRVQYFISADSRTRLMAILSKPGTERDTLKKEMFKLFMGIKKA